MTLRPILLAALLGLAHAAAAAEEFAPDRVEQAVSMADLEAVVTSLGHEIEAEDADTWTLRAHDFNGTRYVLTGTACDVAGVPGCRGIAMQVLFEGDGKVTLEKLAEANLNQVAVSTRFEPETQVISVTRYMVLDGGVAMANIAENIAVLLALTPAVMAIVSGSEEDTAKPD